MKLLLLLLISVRFIIGVDINCEHTLSSSLRRWSGRCGESVMISGAMLSGSSTPLAERIVDVIDASLVAFLSCAADHTQPGAGKRSFQLVTNLLFCVGGGNDDVDGNRLHSRMLPRQSARQQRLTSCSFLDRMKDVRLSVFSKLSNGIVFTATCMNKSSYPNTFSRKRPTSASFCGSSPCSS